MIECDPRSTRTGIHDYRALNSLAPDVKAIVSLHAHTHHSREIMADLPRYIMKIPIVSGMFERELTNYLEQKGRSVDFSKGWWHPPVSPRALFESEAGQIERSFGLPPMVSVTDHDSIDAGLELQLTYSERCAPVSFEWTVPYREGFFHLGVHNLPPVAALDWFEELSAFTRGVGTVTLSALLGALNSEPNVLVVFNHPMWDLADVGRAAHEKLLRGFLSEHQCRLHALELNGYRSAAENRGTCALAAAREMPLISGGDRHGRAPNALLNVTRAGSFGGFVREMREERRSEIVIMPEYREHLVVRKLESAADVLRRYPSFPEGRRHWTDRVSCEWQGAVRPLSFHWPDGGPFWVRSAIGAFKLITSRAVMPVVTMAIQAAASLAPPSTPPVPPSLFDSGTPSGELRPI